MAEIRVDLLQGSNLISRAIEWNGLGYGGYSHGANVLQDNRYLDARSESMGGEWHVGLKKGTTERVPAGVHIRDPFWESSIKRTRYTFEVSQATYDEWEGNSRAKIGTQYAKRAIWGFITGRKVTVNGEWICSMFFINELQHVKIIRSPLSIPAHQIDPNAGGLLMEQAGAILTDITDLYKAPP
jgi:hypothetical protein